MGYETTLVVVNRAGRVGYCDYYASFDLCKIRAMNQDIFAEKLDGFFFFPSNGNKKIDMDEYGDGLYCTSLTDAVTELERLCKDHDHYLHRLAPPLAYLKELQKHSEHLNLVVVHYGH